MNQPRRDLLPDAALARDEDFRSAASSSTSVLARCTWPLEQPLQSHSSMSRVPARGIAILSSCPTVFLRRLAGDHPVFLRCQRSRPRSTANEPAEAPERCGMWILAVDFLAPRFMSWIRPPMHWMPRVGRSKPPTDHGPYSPPPHRRAVITLQPNPARRWPLWISLCVPGAIHATPMLCPSGRAGGNCYVIIGYTKCGA